MVWRNQPCLWKILQKQIKFSNHNKIKIRWTYPRTYLWNYSQKSIYHTEGKSRVIKMFSVGLGLTLKPNLWKANSSLEQQKHWLVSII